MKFASAVNKLKFICNFINTMLEQKKKGRNNMYARGRKMKVDAHTFHSQKDGCESAAK